MTKHEILTLSHEFGFYHCHQKLPADNITTYYGLPKFWKKDKLLHGLKNFKRMRNADVKRVESGDIYSFNPSSFYYNFANAIWLIPNGTRKQIYNQVSKWETNMELFDELWECG